jgi:hypothetical protein
VLNLFYLTMVTNTVKVFDCIDSGDGSVLASEPSIHCDAASDPVYRNLYSLSILFMILYVIGTPFLFLVLMVSGHRELKEPSPAVSPESSSVPELYINDIYKVHRPEYFYWRIVETLKKLTFIGVLRVVPSDRANLQACLLLLVLLADSSLQYCVSPYVHRSIGDDSLNAMEFHARLPLAAVLLLGLAMDAAAKDMDDPRVTNGSSVTKDHLLSRLSALTGVLVAVVVLLICYCSSMILHHRGGKSASSVGVERVRSNPLDGNDPLPAAAAAVVEVVGRGEGMEVKSEENRGGIAVKIHGSNNNSGWTAAALSLVLQRYTEDRQAALQLASLDPEVTTADLEITLRDMLAGLDGDVLKAIEEERAASKSLREMVESLTMNIRLQEAGGEGRRRHV